MKLLERILIPTDFGKETDQAVKSAVAVAKMFNSEIILLHVIPEVSGFPLALEMVKKKVAEQLQDIQNDIEKNGVRVAETAVFTGVPFDQIVRHADHHDVNVIIMGTGEKRSDLLVMGSVGRSGLARVLMGSVTTKVVRQMPCSVITIKSEHAIRLRLTAEIADIGDFIKQGKELLEKGFADEALEQFEQCISRDVLYAPAWEGMSAAHLRLGHNNKSEECKEAAEQIRQELWQKKVEAEARSRHHLTNKSTTIG